MDYTAFQELYEDALSVDINVLIDKLIKTPERYAGVFRASAGNNSLIKNILYAREIQFGDFFEAITTDYIAEAGYENMDKWITTDLHADQLFQYEDSDGYYHIVLAEQKMRDDHDSTKKRAQADNFRLKCEALSYQYPEADIIAYEWFVDPTFAKNRSYYLVELDAINLPNVRTYLAYGPEFLEDIGIKYAWDEIQDYLNLKQQEEMDINELIPNFDCGDDAYDALEELVLSSPKTYLKLAYEERWDGVRRMFFPTRYNFQQIEAVYGIGEANGYDEMAYLA